MQTPSKSMIAWVVMVVGVVIAALLGVRYPLPEPPLDELAGAGRSYVIGNTVNALSLLDSDGTLTVAGASTLTGNVTLGAKLIGSASAITLTSAGQTITPAYGLYILSTTGAISITLAAPSAAGQVLYLYGDDANTITVNDTNIRSTDGNAVTIGQYDVVEWISTATEWIHVAKSADS